MIKTTRKLKSSAIKNGKAEPLRAAAPISAEPPLSAPANTTKAAQKEPARISLELIRPGAQRVCVAGTFNEWKPERWPLAPAGNGRWVGDLSVNPGRYEYLFVVDGQWLPDPNAKENVQNPYGGKNSVLTVSA